MAIHLGDVVETTGFTRRTNKGAERMLFDNLQKGQYVYPIKSTVRELVSNGIDSINEKEIARKILTGEASESDFYYVPGTNPVLDAAIEANPGEYENSRFDSSYYDLKWLDFTSNRVLIKYLESDNTQRDRVQIIDYGVGLSPKRLEGILELGYSTKRLAKSPLGKFGLGAKVALSTGIDFYTVKTNYNGRTTEFNVYGHSANCVIPPFDHDGKNEVAYFSYDEEQKHPYYWKPTQELNNVVVEFEIRKHRKQELISAVKSQLLYFENVDLHIVHTDGYVSQESVQADIIYEDEKIVISNNTQFSKPHIVINNVSYGYIDFLELETEERRGNVGIKFSPHELEVSPSRESVMWTEKTGAAVRQRFRDVETIASDYVTKSLEEPDFMKWWNKARAINGGHTTDNILSAFRSLVDISNIRPKFLTPSGDEIKLGPLSQMAPFITLTKITKKVIWKGGKESTKIIRDEVASFNEGDPVYIKTAGERWRFHTDMYLLNDVHTDGFYVITYKEQEDVKPLLDINDVEWESQRADYFEKTKRVSRFIAKCIAPHVQEGRYETLTTPESYKELEDKKEDDGDEVVLSNEDRRAIEGTIPAKLLGLPYGRTVNDLPTTSDNLYRMYEHKQVELKVSDILELSESDTETYYSTSKDNELLHLAAIIVRPSIEHGEFGYDSWTSRRDVFWGGGLLTGEQDIRFLEVSQNNQRKHGHSWNHITTFFKRFNTQTGIISMSQHLIRWNTARLIDKHIDSLKFLHNFTLFNEELSKTYHKLKSYHETNWRPFNGLFNGSYGSRDETQSDLINYLDNLADLQMVVASGADEETIKDTVVNMFPEEQSPGEVKGAHAVDLDILNELNEVLSIVEPYKVLLNTITPLTNGGTISADLEQEIKSFINFKTGN